MAQPRLEPAAASQAEPGRTDPWVAAAAPRVSVVVPARNAALVLGACLRALEPARQGMAAELIVVDDGSTDATAATAASAGARVITQEARGPAAARNAGAQAARGEILVFLDADASAEPGCLQALCAPFADPAVVGVRGSYTSTQGALIARFVQLELDEKQERLATSARITLLDTVCAAYRRAIFLGVGGFDERFPATSAEDAELSFRLVANGARLAYAPAARVAHRHAERLSVYLYRKLRFGYFRACLYRRHPRRVSDDGYTPRLMPVQIALSGASVLALAASVPWPPARPVAGAALVAFAAVSIPLTRRASRHDRTLALAVPSLLFLRSLAQGCGLVAGGLSMLLPPGMWSRAAAPDAAAPAAASRPFQTAEDAR